jgi:hypothetical protein
MAVTWQTFPAVNVEFRINVATNIVLNTLYVKSYKCGEGMSFVKLCILFLAENLIPLFHIMD